MVTDTRNQEWDPEQPSPYLRRSRRVEVRRSANHWRRLLWKGGVITLLAGGVLAAAIFALRQYLVASPQFALRDPVAIGGAEQVSRSRLEEIFSADRGRSVFEIPLRRRRDELMALPWIETAHVARGWPNRVRIQVGERTPVAYARLTPVAGRIGERLALIDRQGMLLPLPRRGNFPLPVLTGVTESQPDAERQQRVAKMLFLLQELDSEMPRRSKDISEIDLSDLEDAAITVSSSGAAVLVHLGREHFLDRYKFFQENVGAWRRQYGSVRAVDLRFEKQAIVKP